MRSSNSSGALEKLRSYGNILKNLRCNFLLKSLPMPNFPCPNMCGTRRKKLAIIECNMLWVYDKANIAFISLPQCGSPAFLINCDSHNLAVKERCVRSLDLQHKSVKRLREFSLFFAKVDTTLLSLYREEWFMGCSKHNRLGIPGNERHTQNNNTLCFTDFLVLCCQKLTKPTVI